MGGLSSRMVTTTITTTIGGLGLAGVPGLAGFFSKDEVLAAAFHGNRAMWALLLLGAFLTAFYTSRLLFLAFYSGPRMSKEAAHHVHESPPAMTLPLWALAVLTAVAGLALGIPSAHGTRFARVLAPVFPVHEEAHSGFVAYMLLILSVVVVAAGITLAWFMYMSTPVTTGTVGRPRSRVETFLLNAWYVDRLYDVVIVRPLFALSAFLARVFDLGVIDGAVNGIGRVVLGWAGALRQVQTGYVVNYALTMLAGAVLILAFLLSR
jgi:NADH-quinone oxidoreductase subunit L